MAIDAALFVSKRLQRVAFAIVCLVAAQFVMAAVQPEPAAASVRIALAD